ncbi:Mur ligase family protein, partial [Candidatus Microgenomates bacterium]|nr:Mur ligase family protein [Candidatus Microgenomates bacterium]
SNNTEIGIAKYITAELEPGHEIFIVEMGAYKKGEIKAICDLVKPKIGMITGIDEQHIELFGSLENTMRAKYELIENLPPDATVIVNGNNSHCLEMAKRAKKQQKNVLIYRTAKDVSNIKVFRDHLEFDFVAENKKYPLKVNLLGAQNIENVLGAILVAQELKMDMESIRRGVSKIKPADKTMKLGKSHSGLNLVDDTFNANPSGVLSALSYMKLYKGEKILVLTPLIELGEKGSDIHQKLGKTAASICDLILLTNPNYQEAICYGISQGGGDPKKVQVVNKAEAAEIINKITDDDSVVVFEGKEAGKIINDI